MSNTFGSISSGTMREEDLIPTFVDELKYRAEKTGNKDHLKLAAEIEGRMENDDYYGSDDASYDLNEALYYALADYAPRYGYFGSHPGDGSDYGYWLSDSIDEDFDGLYVSDTGEVPNDYTGEVLHENDHGNMTLYDAVNGELTEVWAIV